jgi:predicted Zn-dependent peptidase
MNLDLWHQWLLLRPLIMFLMVTMLLLVAALVGWCKDLRNRRKAARATQKNRVAPVTEPGEHVVRLDEPVAQAESTPQAWVNGRYPSDRHAA